MISLEAIKAIALLSNVFDEAKESKDDEVIRDACMVCMTLQTLTNQFVEEVISPKLKEMEEKGEIEKFDWNSLLNKPEDDK